MIEVDLRAVRRVNALPGHRAVRSGEAVPYDRILNPEVSLDA